VYTGLKANYKLTSTDTYIRTLMDAYTHRGAVLRVLVAPDMHERAVADRVGACARLEAHDAGIELLEAHLDQAAKACRARTACESSLASKGVGVGWALRELPITPTGSEQTEATTSQGQRSREAANTGHELATGRCGWGRI
jgi:hypothetical protein